MAQRRTRAIKHGPKADWEQVGVIYHHEHRSKKGRKQGHEARRRRVAKFKEAGERKQEERDKVFTKNVLKNFNGIRNRRSHSGHRNM